MVLEPETTFPIDENTFDPNRPLPGGGCVFEFLLGVVGSEPESSDLGDLSDRGPLISGDLVPNDAKNLLLLPEIPLVESKIRIVGLFPASLARDLWSTLAAVAAISVVRAAESLVTPCPPSILECTKGFTAQVCVVNSNSRFLLFVSGSR